MGNSKQPRWGVLVKSHEEPGVTSEDFPGFYVYVACKNRGEILMWTAHANFNPTPGEFRPSPALISLEVPSD